MDSDMIHDKINDLEKAIDKLDIIIEAKRRFGNKAEVGLMNKKIEDGILDNLHRMTDYQREHFHSGFDFIWYEELNDPIKFGERLKQSDRNMKLGKIL